MKIIELRLKNFFSNIQRYNCNGLSLLFYCNLYVNVRKYWNCCILLISFITQVFRMPSLPLQSCKIQFIGCSLFRTHWNLLLFIIFVNRLSFTILWTCELCYDDIRWRTTINLSQLLKVLRKIKRFDFKKMW